MARIGMCVFFVKIFCCCVYFVSKETRKRHQHNDKEWKFKEQHAKMWENIAGRKDTLAPVVSTLRGRAPPSPSPFRHLWCIIDAACIVYGAGSLYWSGVRPSVCLSRRSTVTGGAAVLLLSAGAYNRYRTIAARHAVHALSSKCG